MEIKKTIVFKDEEIKKLQEVDNLFTNDKIGICDVFSNCSECPFLLKEKEKKSCNVDFIFDTLENFSNFKRK